MLFWIFIYQPLLKFMNWLMIAVSLPGILDLWNLIATRRKDPEGYTSNT